MHSGGRGRDDPGTPSFASSLSGGVAAYAVGTVIVLPLMVTEPSEFEPPRSRPSTAEPVSTVIVTEARMLPLKIVVVFSVADVPTCQKMLLALAPPARITCAPAPVVRVEPIWKMKIASGSPCASSVTLFPGPEPWIRTELELV